MKEDNKYLYRGVSPELYQKTGGKLVPKSTDVFAHTFKYGESGLKYGSGATYGSSPANAVLKHQHNQEGYPTSGVSTTPHLARAHFYATCGGKYGNGYIYKIDRELLEINGVKEYVVAQYVTSPSIPEDDEVIIVEKDFSTLPDAIIAEIIVLEKNEISERE